MTDFEALQQAAEYADSFVRPSVRLTLHPIGLLVEVSEKFGSNPIAVCRVISFRQVAAHHSPLEMLKAEIDVAYAAVVRHVREVA